MVRAEAAARLRLRRLSSHPLTYLDVFTNRPLTGNQLAVVHDADTLADAAMSAFARETRFSETTYVQAAPAAGADYRNRIWTPERELPFAGHPSLGTAVAVAARRGDDEASYVQQTGAGLQPVEVVRRAERLWRASMLQEPATFGSELDPAPPLAALGLDLGDAHRDLPPQLVSTGLEHLLLPLEAPGALKRIEADSAAIDALPGATLYAFALEEDRARARAFPGSLTMGEDPATGSAAGPLGAYLAARLGRTRIEIDQGIEMGRPSRLSVAIARGRARVAGDVVVLADAMLHLD